MVSDTHLSPRTPEADANWDAVVAHVERTAPDLVLHLGDLALDGPRVPTDLDHARARLDRLPVPWHAIPGNHDVGDNPSGVGSAEPGINAERRRRWIDVVGPDRWSLELDGWTLIGLDVQLLGSGLDAEAEQWAWLHVELATIPSDRPLALALHKPLTAGADELAAAPHYRFIPVAARTRLLELFESRTVPLVLTGHVHQFRLLDVAGTRHVWAPTTWAVLPDEMQATYGTKRCGIVSVTLDADRPPQATLVEPDGIGQHTITGDIPRPYT